MRDPHFIHADAIDAAAILAVWSARLPIACKLVGTSLFGDLFVETESGAIEMLDIVSGEVKEVATCVEEFEWDRTQPLRREELLMQSLADAALAAGHRPGPRECLAFRTPPMMGGPVSPSNLVCWNILDYHTGLAKLLAQVKDLPLGTQVVPKSENA